jgi:dihydroorotate dehydrogenase
MGAADGPGAKVYVQMVTTWCKSFDRLPVIVKLT